MSKAPRGQRHKAFVLNQIEKLDATHPNLIHSVKAWLDQGTPARNIPGLIQEHFQVSVTDGQVEEFRTMRWVPEKQFIALKIVTTKAALEAFGGDAGFDAVLLAKLWELMDAMTIPQLLQARALFVRVRAQNLKEQEFLYKTGQLKPGQPAGGEEPDPETQQKNVLRRIKEIFGLTVDEPPVTPAPAPETSPQMAKA